MTAEEYMAVDSQLQTCECLANRDILAMVTSQPDQQSSDEEEEEELDVDGRVASAAAGSVRLTH